MIENIYAYKNLEKIMNYKNLIDGFFIGPVTRPVKKASSNHAQINKLPKNEQYTDAKLMEKSAFQYNKHPVNKMGVKIIVIT